MGVLRVGEAKELLQVHLSRGGAQQVRPPDHLVHPGLPVVHRHCQLVHIDPVGPADHHIPAVRGKIHGEPPLNPVLHRPLPVRHQDPPGRGAAESLPLGSGQAPAGAGVDVGAVA